MLRLLVIICCIILFLFLFIIYQKRKPSACQILKVQKTSNPGILVTFKTPSKLGYNATKFQNLHFEIKEINSDGTESASVMFEDVNFKKLNLESLSNPTTTTTDGSIPCYTNDKQLIDSSWLTNASQTDKILKVKLNLPNIALGVYKPYFKNFQDDKTYKIGIAAENDNNINSTMAYSDTIEWNNKSLILPLDGQVSSYSVNTIAYIRNKKLKFYVQGIEKIGDNTDSIQDIESSTNFNINQLDILKLQLIVGIIGGTVKYWIVFITANDIYCINYSGSDLSIIKLPDNQGPFVDFVASFSNIHAIRSDRTIAIWNVDNSNFNTDTFSVNNSSNNNQQYRNIKISENQVCAINIKNDKIECWQINDGTPITNITNNCEECLKFDNQESYYDFTVGKKSNSTFICAIKKNNKVICTDNELNEKLKNLSDIETINQADGSVIVKNVSNEIFLVNNNQLIPIQFNANYPKIIINHNYTDIDTKLPCIVGIKPGSADESVYCIDSNNMLYSKVDISNTDITFQTSLPLEAITYNSNPTIIFDDDINCSNGNFNISVGECQCNENWIGKKCNIFKE